jgi:hypothetical protein
MTPELHRFSHDLMPRNDRHHLPALIELALDDVQIGPADAAGAYLDEHFTAAGRRALDLDQFERPVCDRRDLLQKKGLHDGHPTARGAADELVPPAHDR